jgi:hypothetical protein
MVAGESRHVWLDVRTQVIAGEIPTLMPNVAMAFCFNSNGYLVVCDGARPAGQGWVVLDSHPPLAQSTWARVTVSLDYATQIWDVYLNGQVAATGLGFVAPKVRPLCVIAQGNGGVMDNLYIGHAPPADIVIPDAWKIEYFGHTLFGDGDDPDNDGLSNRQEYLAGTDPADPMSALIFTSAAQILGTGAGTPLYGEMNNGAYSYEIAWQSVAGRSYTLQATTNLVNGFDQTIATGIKATPPINRFSDPIGSAAHKIYRVVLEIP